MTRYVKRGGNIWIRVFPDKPITKKPLEVRQGKGKGNVEYWVAQIAARQACCYEMAGVTEAIAREAFAPRGGEAAREHHVRQTAGGLNEGQARTRTAQGHVRRGARRTSCLKLRREQFNLRMRRPRPVRARSPTSTAKVRRNIARLKTLQHARVKSAG